MRYRALQEKQKSGTFIRWVNQVVVVEQPDGLLAVCLSRTGTAHLTRLIREQGLTLGQVDILDPYQILDPTLGETRWTEIRDSQGRTIHELLAQEEPVAIYPQSAPLGLRRNLTWQQAAEERAQYIVGKHKDER